MRTKSKFLIGYLAVIGISYLSINYYIIHREIFKFPPSNLSVDLFNNRELTQEYNLCVETQREGYGVRFAECNLQASRVQSWLTHDLDVAQCNLNQAKAIEKACEPLIVKYRLK